MDFEEALDEAIRKRKYLILRQIKQHTNHDEEEEAVDENEMQEGLIYDLSLLYIIVTKYIN